MSTFIGRLASIGIAKESVRGTPVVPTFFIPQVNLTLDEKVEMAIQDASVGRIEDAEDANVVKKFSEGSLEGRISVESFGLLLLNAIGADTPSINTPETGVTTHAFSVKQDAQHPSLTFSVSEPNSAKSFPLGMITSLELVAAINEYAAFTAEIRAKKGESASLTPVFVDADEKKIFVPQNGTFKTAANLAGLAAAPEIKIQNFTITIDKNVEDDTVIGNVDPNDILNKQFSIEGTIELLYRDTVFIDDLLADTAKAIRITLENTAVTIGATTNPKLEIDLARVKFSEVSRPLPNDDLIVQTVSFKAFFSLADSKMLDVTLINETASY